MTAVSFFRPGTAGGCGPHVISLSAAAELRRQAQKGHAGGVHALEF